MSVEVTVVSEVIVENEEVTMNHTVSTEDIGHADTGMQFCYISQTHCC